MKLNCLPFRLQYSLSSQIAIKSLRYIASYLINNKKIQPACSDKGKRKSYGKGRKGNGYNTPGLLSPLAMLAYRMPAEEKWLIE